MAKPPQLFLAINDSDRPTMFAIVKLESEIETWRLWKVLPDGSMDRYPYDVSRRGSVAECDCAALMRPEYGECRHIKALRFVGLLS